MNAYRKIFNLAFVAILIWDLCAVTNGYTTYPRRYSRDKTGSRCPDHCRCMTLNQRGTRGLLDTWGGEQVSDRGFKYFSRGSGDEAARNGRSMVCQGLRELPDFIPNGKYAAFICCFRSLFIHSIFQSNSFY